MNQSQQLIESLTTGNPQHGFFRAIQIVSDVAELSAKEAGELFDHAGQGLIKRFKADGRKFGEKQAKQWLDSQSGRFLVDSIPETKPNVPELKKAITKAISTLPWITKKAGQP